ncbi:hypothetical protein EON65_57100, partial [archaeon]
MDHIYLGVAFPWQSEDMWNALRLFAPYIQAGQLTLFSQTDTVLPFEPNDVELAEARQNYRFAAGGALLHYDASKPHAINMCLYFSKGLADYLAVWDVDEFLVPAHPEQTIQDILGSVDREYCYLELPSSTYFRVDDYINLPKETPNLPSALIKNRYTSASVYYNLWITKYYRKFTLRKDFLSHRKSIHNINDEYSIGLHIGSTCTLGNRSIEHAITHEYYVKLNKTTQVMLSHMQFSRDVRFEMSTDKQLPLRNETCLLRNRYMTFHGMDCNDTNLYGKFYGDKVQQRLKLKGYYDALMLLSDSDYSHQSNVLKYFDVYNNASLIASHVDSNSSKTRNYVVLPHTLLSFYQAAFLSTSFMRKNNQSVSLVTHVTSTHPLTSYNASCLIHGNNASYISKGRLSTSPQHNMSSNNNSVYRIVLSCAYSATTYSNLSDNELAIRLSFIPAMPSEDMLSVSLFIRIPKGMI